MATTGLITAPTQKQADDLMYKSMTGGVTNTWGEDAAKLESTYRMHGVDETTISNALAKLPKPVKQEVVADYEPYVAPTTAPYVAPTTAPSTAPVTATQSTAGQSILGVAPQQTVQEQIRGIIAENSPLMQQARATSRGQMNERGLINSSIANTAGQAAVLQAAMPIAQADAAMYADTAKTNNAYANQFATANNLQIRDLQKMATAQGYNLETMSAQQINDMAKLNAQILATTARDKSAIEADKATATAAAKEAATAAAKRVENDNAATKLETDNAQILLNYKLASEAQNTYNTTFNAINASADDALTKKTKIDAAWNQYKNTIANVRAASSVAGLAQLVNFATGAGPGSTAPGATPTTDIPGLSNDAKWEGIVKTAWDAHVAKFGVGWDTSKTSPADRAANLQRMKVQYNA